MAPRQPPVFTRRPESKRPEARTAKTGLRIPAVSPSKLFAICLLLGLATLVVYYRAIGNPFVNYDDTAYVTENPHIQQGLTADTWRWAISTTTESNWHPLTWLSHALDCQLYGLNPAGHHFSSLLLHVMSVLILFLLLQRATGATGRSLMVAALFGLHPINVESVAWVAERKNVLSMFFFSLTLGAYGWYARRPNVGRYVVVGVLFALGLAAKPMIVTLPFVLLLVDFWPLQRVLNWQPPSPAFPVPQSPLWRLGVEKVPLLLLSVASSVMTMAAQKPVIVHNEHLSWLARVVNALYAYSMYVMKAFWPTHLAAFYPYEGLRLASWEAVLCLLFLAGISGLVWRGREHAYWVVGWLWFLGTLIPMIGLVQVGDQAMADRYAYLPLLGIFTMVVWGAGDWAESRRFDRRWLVAVGGIVLTVLSWLTWRQIGVWHSSPDLWAHALKVTKDNYLAEDYAGAALLVQAYDATGQRYTDESLVHFQNAIRMNPDDVIGHLNLGADLHERGRLQEAIQQYQLVLKLTDDVEMRTKTLIDLGAVYRQLDDYTTAHRYYDEVRKMDPHNSVLFTNLGKMGMGERAQQLAALAASHPLPETYVQLGQLQLALGEVEKARASYQEALKLKPGMAEARSALAKLGKEKNPPEPSATSNSLP